MAVASDGEISIDTTGFAFKKASQIVDSEINQIVVSTDRINDFSTGSITRTMIEAEAIEIEKLYYYTLENLKLAIDDAVTSAFGFTRRTATYAYGSVRVDLNSSLAQDLYIPRGTRFFSTYEAYEQVYRTQVPYRIPKGSRSFELTVYCTVMGTYGNIPSEVINRTDDLGAITNVTNPEAFNTGQDEESPQQTKIRFRQMIQSIAKGTNQSLVYAAESVPNVAGGYLYESTYGTVVLYAHDLNGNLDDNLREQISKKIVQYRPAGIKVIIHGVHKTMVTMNIAVDVTDENLRQIGMLQTIRRTISDYVNSLTVGDPLYKADVLQKIMDINDTGIRDAKVEIRVWPDNSLLAEPMVSDDTVINVKSTLLSQPYLRPDDITTNENTYGMIGLKDTKIKPNAGNNWRDALVVADEAKKEVDTTDNDSLRDAYEDGNVDLSKVIKLDDAYITSPNEILRLGICNVQFIPRNGDSTYLADNDGRIVRIKTDNGGGE